MIGYNKKCNCELIDRSPWWIFVRLSTGNWSLVLGIVYFKPSSDLGYLLELLQGVISDIQIKFPTEAVFVGGDFNARVGDSDLVHENSLEGSSLFSTRMSLYPDLNSRGSKLIEFFQTNSFVLINGRTPGDIPAQFTYCSGRGKSVIDLVWANFLGSKHISQFSVRSEPTLSDHFAVSLFLSYPSLLANGKSHGSPLISKKLLWDHKKRLEFSTAMLWSSKLKIDFEHASLNHIHHNFIAAIAEASDRVGLLKVSKSDSAPRKSIKPWYDMECKDLKTTIENRSK